MVGYWKLMVFVCVCVCVCVCWQVVRVMLAARSLLVLEATSKVEIKYK